MANDTTLLSLQNGHKLNFPAPPIPPEREYAYNFWNVCYETPRSQQLQYEYGIALREYERIKYVIISLEQPWEIHE